MEEKLFWKRQNTWETFDEKERDNTFQLAEEYKAFVSQNKTERQVVTHLVEVGKQRGFRDLEEFINKGETLKPGDKVYYAYREKALAMAIIGEEPLNNGFKVIGSHVDCPRIDLKPNPLYEAADLAWFKTHYYGGIKKYQWVATPLALHGVVFTQGGKRIDISLGEDDQDPVFTITDLLPHLASKQMEKKMSEAITGEGLNILVGSIPLKDSETKEKIKHAILDQLHKTYGFIEEDFTVAELQLVPAGKARDVGFDRSIIGSYGHDDRVCAFASWKAIEDIGTPRQTALIILMDKEETGSAGNTGMQSNLLEVLVAELLQATGQHVNTLNVLRALGKSRALSADVNLALDPNFEAVIEKNNTAKLGYGVVITKYTGARGKSGTSDANAEFVQEVRKLFNDNKVNWQTGELGAVDQGGGGTIAQFLARYGMEVLDCGVALLSMHAPFELVSKADLAMMVKGYKAFLK